MRNLGRDLAVPSAAAGQKKGSFRRADGLEDPFIKVGAYSVVSVRELV